MTCDLFLILTLRRRQCNHGRGGLGRGHGEPWHL